MLVERNRQLNVLQEMLASCAPGAGGVALVRGPAGGGKTTLLHGFGERAVAAGARWISVTAAQSAPASPGLLGRLAQAVGIPDPGAALDSLRDLAARAPLVVSVDDLHHAETALLELVPELVAQLTAAGALVVVVGTTAPGHRWQAVHTELLRHPKFCSVVVATLSPAGVATVLSEHVGAAVPGTVAAECRAATGGNPLLVRAMAEDLSAADVAGRAPVHGGEAFTEAVLACLRRCGPETARVAEGLAVLDAAGTPRVLGGLLGMTEGLIDRHLGALAEMGLVAGTHVHDFRHAATRLAVTAAISPERQAELHTRTARVLHEQNGRSVDIARHLLAGGTEKTPWAVGVLREAAEHARVDDPGLATRCLERARVLCSGEAEYTEITADLVTIGWWFNPAEAAARLSGLADAFAGGRVGARSAVMLCGQLFWHGHVDEAVRMYKQVRRSAEADSPAVAPELRILELWMAFSCPPVAPDLQLPGPREPRERSSVVTSAEARLRAFEVLTELFTDGPADHLVEEAIRILEVCSLRHMSLGPSRFALQVLVHAGRLDEARAWCRTLLEESDAREMPSWRATFSETQGQIALLGGDLPATVEHAQAALTHITPRSWGIAVGSPISGLVQALVGMGQYAQAAAELDRPVPAAMFRTRWGVQYLYARGQYYLATGRFRAALGDFLVAGDTLTRWGMDSPLMVPWRCGAAEAHLRSGAPAEAVRLLAEQARRPGGNSRWLRGTAGRIRAEATGSASERLRVARAAVEDLEAGDQLELARALACLAGAHRDLGDFRRARMITRRALEIATGCRAEPLVVALTWKGPGTDQGDDEEYSADALSDAERRVAELASMGNTNREIARALFITVSTVEQHLTRVYRKLKVRRRTDLPVDFGPMAPRSA